jgi:lysophospholipase L1-like esterase
VSDETPGFFSRSARRARRRSSRRLRDEAPGPESRRGAVRRIAWAANAVLASASLAAFLVAAEALCRVFDLRPDLGHATANPAWLGNRWLLPRDDYRERLADEGFLGRYYELYEWDRFLFFRLRSHVKLELLDPIAPKPVRDRTRWVVQTNSRGFRSPEFADAGEPSAVRVAALGDSSTFGWGVQDFETYPRRLEAALQRELRGPDDRRSVEVLNLGVPGYSTFQGKTLLERQALGWSPDVITWSYLANDGAPTGEPDAAAYQRRLGVAGAALELLHRSRAFEAFEGWVGVARARLRPPKPPDAQDPATRNVASYEEATAHVSASIGAARAAGVPMVLVVQCVRGQVAGLLHEVASATGTPILDATALLDGAIARVASQPEFAAERQRIARRYGPRSLDDHPQLHVFLPDGCHPNALGHRRVADELSRVVAEALRSAGSPGAR